MALTNVTDPSYDSSSSRQLLLPHYLIIMYIWRELEASKQALTAAADQRRTKCVDFVSLVMVIA